jgi:hypothetical protein
MVVDKTICQHIGDVLDVVYGVCAGAPGVLLLPPEPAQLARHHIDRVF